MHHLLLGISSFNFSQADQKNRYRGFADMFPLKNPLLNKRLKMITMEEFVNREGGPQGQVPIPEHLRGKVHASADHCDKRKQSKFVPEMTFNGIFFQLFH